MDRWKPSGIHVRRQGADVAEVPVQLVVVQAVADHELVGDVPADVLHVDVHPQGLGLAEQGADGDGGGVAGGEVGGEPGQGEPGVDDLVDDQHVAPADVGVEVLQDAYDARA